MAARRSAAALLIWRSRMAPGAPIDGWAGITPRGCWLLSSKGLSSPLFFFTASRAQHSFLRSNGFSHCREHFYYVKMIWVPSQWRQASGSPKYVRMSCLKSCART
jgi:hypothetical protein